MRQTERDLRKRVVKLLQSLDAFSVENAVGEDGVPDVCCVLGWIELKVAVRPKMDSTSVDIDVRPGQRVWHRSWARHGGVSWWLTEISGTDRGSLWLIHDGVVGADALGVSSLSTLERTARMTITTDARPLLDTVLRDISRGKL